MTSTASSAPAAPSTATGVPVFLTEPEAALWRYQQRHPLSPAYNICAAVEIEGPFDAALLQAAARAVIARHRRLHSAIRASGERLAWQPVPGEPSWRTVPVAAPELREWAEGPGAAQMEEEARRPFRPGEVLHRLVLWDLGTAGVLLQLTLHHCACDGLSLRLLTGQIISGYRDRAEGPAPTAAACPVLPYQPLVSAAEAADFFAPRLRLAQSRRLLPPGRNRRRSADDAGVLVRRVLDVTVADGAARAKEAGVSLFAVVMAGVGAAVSQWSGEQTFAVRVPFSCRPPAEDAEVSYRVRALPVALSVTGGESVADLLTRTGGELREAVLHADWGDEEAPVDSGVGAAGTSLAVVNQLQPAGLLSHHRTAPLHSAGLQWRPYLVRNGTAKFDLSIHVAAHDGRVALTFEYRAIAVDRSEREWFADLAAATVTDIVTAALDEDVARLARRHEVRAVPVRSGRAVSQHGGRVEDAFFAQAERHPERLAVVDDAPGGAVAVNYGELASASCQLAEQLTTLGAGAGCAVAVRLPRGAVLIAAVHGVLRAGGVLLLLDPDLPSTRSEFMLADSRAHLLIEAAPAPGPDTLTFMGHQVRITVLEKSVAPIPLAREAEAAEAAYVMYTSGSTGRPKGVAISHAGITNRLAWMQRAFPLAPENVVLAKTALSFDVCLWELLWPPMTGATVVAARHGRHGDADYLCDVVDRFAVDTVHFVPAMLGAFLDAATGRRFPALRRVFTSGERLALSLARQAHARLGADLHNLYGPTEASIDVTRFTYRPADGRAFVPIGRPIDNIAVRVCDPDGRQVPPGVPGELVIGGVGVALGYLGDGSLDAGRFGVDPDSGQSTYRTGDLVRWRSGGVLEFLGRADDQVKINGQRVELEEIDAVLTGHPHVAAAAVIHRSEDAGQRRLQAFLVPDDGAEPTAEELRAHAAGHLAASLIPTLFTLVEKLPYAASGKLDRTRLAGMTGRDLPTTEGRAPATDGESEALLTSAVGEVLGEREIPADADLFHLGLDSITALRLVAVLRRRGCVLEVADVFEARTVSVLAARQLTIPAIPVPPQAAADDDRAAERWKGHRVRARFPLSQLQLGLVYHRQVSDDYLTYLTSYELEGTVDAALLREALADVAGRHEFLRSALDLTDPAGPQQVVVDAVAPSLDEHDLSPIGEAERQAAWERWRHEVRRRPFSWDTPPLFAFHLHRLGAGRAVFSIVEPFLDGWSVAVLGRDILDTYERLAAGRDRTEPPTTAQPQGGEAVPSYATFVALERAAAVDEEALAHWRQVLEQPDTAWRLALAPGDSGESTTWHRHDHFLDENELAALRAAADRLQVSLRTLMWAVHMRTVALFTGRHRSGSAVMVNGRPEEAGSEAMVGLFLNLLPVSVEIGQATTWRDLVAQLVAAEQTSWRYRRTPYAALRSLVPGFEPSTVFNYTEFHRYRDLFNDPGRVLRLCQVTALDQTYVDLTVQCSLDPAGRRLRLSVDHRAPAVTTADARRFLACLVHAARAAARDVDARLDVDRLPQEELARVEGFGRGPVRAWPQELSLARIVDAHADARPDAVAIEDAAESFTYAELRALSRHYAHQVRQHSTVPHPVVGVMASRSARYWAAVLGIWRAGGTYVALSPNLPAERLAQMTGQAGTHLAFVDPRDGVRPEPLPATVRHLALGGLPGQVAELEQQPLAEAAYVLFTSGSTGRPKGARIGPAAMVNHWWAKADLLALDETCAVGQSAPASFDVSLWQFAVPWLRGGRVVVLADELLLDPAGLFTVLDDRAVRLFETVPSHLAAVLDTIACGAVPWPRPRSSLTCLMVTGEAVPAEVCRRWLRAGGAPIVNAYGPTECADDITHQVIDDPSITGVVPIGRPIPNTVCQVTDDAGLPVPLGVEGELRVTGACLGLGYLNPGDEAGRFLHGGAPPHPVVAYRTGDRVRFTEGGELLWLGRADEEVKVRGRRIELGDIETHLRTHPAVKDAATVVLPEGGGRLRAVVVARTGQTGGVDRAVLLSHLSAHLPAWMLPDEITVTTALPLTAHGKLDRNRLATAPFAPAVRPKAPTHAAAAGDVAAVAAQEWEQITGRAPGADSDFFAEGGSSLDSVRLTARISARLGVAVTVADLLRAPRFADFTARLDPQATTSPAPVPSGRATTAVPGIITATLDTADELLALMPGSRLDVAAVGYLTPAALARSGHQAHEVLQRMGEAPVLRRILHTPLGTVGHYLIPLVGDEIFTAPGRLAEAVAQVTEHAHHLGAARTALTGLIPAACKYGTSLPAGAAVTTGHDVTTAAVVLNAARALRTTGTDLNAQHVAVIGLGSIGRAATELLLHVLGHPAALTLVESPAAEHRLRTTWDAVRAAGYDGPVHPVIAPPTGVSERVAGAGLVIGAASATGLLDPDRLAAGPIVVDDSAPHLFDTVAAVRRARAGEIYVSEGGVLEWPEPLREVRWAPTDPVLADALAALRGYRPTPRTVMGCLIAALPGLTGDQPPVRGEPTPVQTRAVYQHLVQAGFDGAPMMLEDTLLLPEPGGAA